MPWYTKAPLPEARHSHAAFALGGLGYVVCGYTTTHVATVRAYDPATDTWSSRANASQARYRLTGHALGSLGYAAGGYTTSRVTTHEAYDPSTNTWSSRAALPAGTYWLASYVLGGLAYIAGGYTSSVSNQHGSYDPAANAWTNRANLPAARYALIAYAIGDRGYAVAGRNASADLANNEAYDPSTNTWSARAALPVARSGAVGFAIGGRGYVVGGQLVSGTVLGRADVYDPVTDTWSTADDLPTARYWAGAFVVDDIAYVVGGHDGSDATAVNEAYQTGVVRTAGAVAAGSSTVGASGNYAIAAIRGSVISGEATVDATAALRFAIGADAAGRASIMARLGQDLSAGAHVAGRSQVTSRIGRERTISLSVIGRTEFLADAGVFGAIVPDLGPLRLEVAVGSGFASVYPVLSASYKWKLGELGEFSVTVPVTAANVDVLDVGKLVRLVRQGEGIVFAGFFSTKRTVLEDDGPVIELAGYGLSRELSLQTTKISWIVDGEPIGETISSLLLPGWTASVERADELITAIFEGATRFEAIAKIAQQKQLHLRPEADRKTVTLFATVARSPFRLVLYPTAPPYLDPYSIPIQKVRVIRRDEEVINRIIPLGAGEGINVLDLRWSDRTEPYQIRSGTMPTGDNYYYLEDDESIESYGLRERVVVFKNVAPIANSPAAYREAANTLYELAAAWLTEHKEPRNEWEISVLGPARLRDPRTGEWLLVPGQLVHVLAKGVAEDVDGKRIIVDIDTDAFVRGISRSFKGDVEEIDFELSTSTEPESGQDALSEVVERLWALSVYQKHFTFQQQFGPLRQAIDASHPVQMRIVWDESVRFLHKVTLDIVARPLRANARATESGGGVTLAGGGHTHGISIRGTSTSPSSVSTTSAEAAHSHTVVYATGEFNAWASWNPTYWQQIIFINQSGTDNYGVYVGRQSTARPNEYLRVTSYDAHSHTIDLRHSHTIEATATDAADHTHVIPSHRHDLEWGVFEYPLPTTKGIRVYVNGTLVAGPFDDSERTIDITAYLQNEFRLPVQQNNVIEVRASALFDIELTVRAIVTVPSVVPL